MKSTKFSVISLFWIGLAAAGTYLLLATTIAVTVNLYLSPRVTVGTPLKGFVEENGLNVLGDALSGFFAPATFLIVVITLYMQSRQVEQNIADMAEQNRLAKVTAHAQYKFALYDKRMVVYRRLVECATSIVDDAGLTVITQGKIKTSVEDAKFIFGPDVKVWVSELSQHSLEYMWLLGRIKRLEKKWEETTMPAAVSDELDTLLHREREEEQWLFDTLTVGKVDEVFAASLELPESVY